MTEAVGGAGGSSVACFEDSRERLDREAEELREAERRIEHELGLAIVGTVRVAATCVGSAGGLQTASCVIAVAQHFQSLLELRRLSDDYARQVEEYQEALKAHLACLPR